NCELREDLRSVCQDREINLYATYRSNSEEWIVNMVRAGIGVALMPEYTLPKHADDISFRYLSEPAITRQVYAFHASAMLQKSELKVLCAGLSCGL
ncbi:MAG: LysR family transcriptional regulator substrate-binding protein, partial [Methylococcales bacterium]|nr:LysR family transcriptional regulator substrate-binding protein [Methylococcales bacterium]